MSRKKIRKSGSFIRKSRPASRLALETKSEIDKMLSQLDNLGRKGLSVGDKIIAAAEAEVANHATPNLVASKATADSTDDTRSDEERELDDLAEVCLKESMETLREIQRRVNKKMAADPDYIPTREHLRVSKDLSRLSVFRIRSKQQELAREERERNRARKEQAAFEKKQAALEKELASVEREFDAVLDSSTEVQDSCEQNDAELPSGGRTPPSAN